MNWDDVIKLDPEEYQELLDDRLKLRCLEDMGIDNWDYYDDAMEHYNFEKNN